MAIRVEIALLSGVLWRFLEMMNSVKYQVFGSEDSLDLDVCFFVQEIGTVENSKSNLKACIQNFETTSSKVVNGNLAVVKNGRVAFCFKGSVDELNNALYLTYGFHKQDYTAQINGLVKRDVYTKIVRCNRTIISYFSRTAIRKEVKRTLHSSEQNKLFFLNNLILTEYDDFKKNGSRLDVYKTFAFQLGQTVGLLEGYEFYSKTSISKQYPVLEPYLNRVEQSGKVLNEMIKLYVKLANEWLSNPLKNEKI